MKKFLLVLAVAGFAVACNNSGEKKETSDTPAATVDTTTPAPTTVDTTKPATVDTTKAAKADTTKK